ncbi:vitellogenin-like [Xyrauchen texanus]|uniref:vitellogenin-like n=1 Tax=Xyrauchen texanus TaxID=154827 RepID=UPI002241FA98|nr:vitellogenin-like [Xyrauchen texanus]
MRSFIQYNIYHSQSISSCSISSDVHTSNSDLSKIYIVHWMRGQTCGLCGKADGEIRQEYCTPSGYLTKTSVSFAHSWVLPAESCRDANYSKLYVSENLSSNYEKTEDLKETVEAHVACHCIETCV